VNFVRLDEYTKSLQPSELESGSISTVVVINDLEV
jgi:hypothetical protein